MLFIWGDAIELHRSFTLAVSICSRNILNISKFTRRNEMSKKVIVAWQQRWWWRIWRRKATKKESTENIAQATKRRKLGIQRLFSVFLAICLLSLSLPLSLFSRNVSIFPVYGLLENLVFPLFALLVFFFSFQSQNLSEFMILIIQVKNFFSSGVCIRIHTYYIRI